MSNNDTTSYDEFNPGMQDWFFDELQGNNSHPNYDFSSSFNIQMDDGPPESPPAASSNNMHAPQNSDQSSQMQPSHSNNIYQGNGNQMDDMMPSTSDYGMQQQHPVNQQPNQIHHQSQQQSQFETLRPYNPGQMQTQNNYQTNQQIYMVFDSNIDLEFMMNEPTTSSAMPMECGIPQDYGQQGQQQYQQQINPNESQWMPMDNTSHNQQNQRMTVVYTSTSQSMPKIPDPGGHPNHQPQILNYNQTPQQVIQTGPNGETILTSMQPVQQIHPIVQSQYDMNSNSYVQYVDQSGGSQQFLSQEQGMHQQNEQSRIPPKTKPKATKSTAKKKSNQQPVAPASAIEAMMARMHAKMVEVRLPPESSMRLFELLQKASETAEMAKQGIDVSADMKMYEQQLTELLNTGDIAPKNEVQPVVPKMEIQPSYTPQQYILPTSAQPKKKKPTKAELQQKKADAVAAAAQPLPFQTPIAVNDSRIQIHAQDSNSITVNYDGKMMKAIMVSTANGTATYQILPESEQGTPVGLVQPSSSGRGPPTGRQRQVLPASSVGREADSRIMNIVTEVVDSCKGNKKGLAPRAKGKKSIDGDIDSKAMFPKQTLRGTDPLCVPSTSTAAFRNKIHTPGIAQLAKPIRDRRENRRRKVAEFLKKIKENLEMTDIDSPFSEKQDVLHRLLPYGFHLEPNLSDKAVETYENELFRHQVHNELQKQSIEKRMKNLFLREAMQPIPDVELNMLLAIDLEYERKLFEEDKARAASDREAFIRDSEIIQAGITMDEIDKAKQVLASTKTKVIKPHPHTKGLVFEPSKFDEETYRRRRQELQHQMRSRRSESSESSSSSEDISEPPSPIMEQTVKIPPPAPRKYRSPSASSESSNASSDESFMERKRSKKEKTKKNHTFESPKNSSPIRKSPKKNDYGHRSLSPVKPLKEKKEKTVVSPVMKQKVPPSLPPGYSSLEAMKFGNYKIPKIGETAKSHMPKPISPKKEIVTESKQTSHKNEGVVKPFTIKFNDFNTKHVNEKESDKIKAPKPERDLPSSRPLNSIKLAEIQSKSSADSSLHKEREPLITKISTKGFDSAPTIPPIKLPKERKEVENKVVSENVNISTEYLKKKSEPTPMAAPLKLKISVGGIKTEEMTEEERKKEKKRRKKEKKERERLEREEKEKDGEKYLKKLKKEKRRAEKEERRRQEQLQKEAGSQMSNVSSVNSNPATPDPQRLVVRIKMQEPEPPKPVQNNPPPLQPQPLVIPKLTVKLPKPIKEEISDHHEHKREKKEKKKHKKEESQAESSKIPPRKIQKLTIKIGQNSGVSSSDYTGSHGRHENPPVLPRQNSSNSQSSISMNRFSPPPTLTNQFIPEADLSHDTSFSSTGPSMSMFDTSLMPRSGNASSLSMRSKPQSELEVKDLKAITGNILLRIRDQ